MGRDWAVMANWSRRRWIVALVGAVLTAVLIAIPTAVIPSPIFGRAIAVTWFAPVQPFIAVISIGLMAVALRIRLRGEVACAIPAAASPRPVDSAS